jgi:cupin fold WbuC family metalloprotein
MMIKITDGFIDQTTNEARQSSRLRMNFNFHQLQDPVNRMLNALEPGTYIQPHKHENPDRFEVFLALRGKFAVIIFDETGTITDHIVLDPNMGNYGVEIPPKTYHTLIALESGSVAYEIKEGPYMPAIAKNFAPWAPTENDENAREYLHSLFTKTGLGNL